MLKKYNYTKIPCYGNYFQLAPLDLQYALEKFNFCPQAFLPKQTKNCSLKRINFEHHLHLQGLHESHHSYQYCTKCFQECIWFTIQIGQGYIFSQLPISYHFPHHLPLWILDASMHRASCQKLSLSLFHSDLSICFHLMRARYLNLFAFNWNVFGCSVLQFLIL